VSAYITDFALGGSRNYRKRKSSAPPSHAGSGALPAGPTNAREDWPSSRPEELLNPSQETLHGSDSFGENYSSQSTQPLQSHPATYNGSRAFFSEENGTRITAANASHQEQLTPDGPQPSLDHPPGGPPPTASTRSETVSVDVYSGSNVWSNPLEVAHLADYATTGTAPRPADMESCSSPQTLRSDLLKHRSRKYFVYSGDTLNHSFLPHMTGHRRFHKNNQRQARMQKSRQTVVHNDSWPAAPLPSPEWESKKLRNDESEASVFDHLSPEDVFYLTRLKNVLCFPQAEVTHAFMSAFHQHVLPALPVIDRDQMNDTYDEFLSGIVQSPMLFHSMFFSSAQYVGEETIRKAGFESRFTAREYFYKRATTLYSLNCEYDQIKIVQTLLFVSPWWGDYSEEKGTKFWISCACNLVLAMGLHKAVPKAARISEQERSMWRRIFWTVYVSPTPEALQLLVIEPLSSSTD